MKKLLSVILLLLLCGLSYGQTMLRFVDTSATNSRQVWKLVGVKHDTTVAPLPIDFDNSIYKDTVRIDSLQSLSGSSDLTDKRLVGIQMPSTWTTAGLSFKVSYDGINFYDLYFDDSEVTMSAGANYYIASKPWIWHGIRYLKVRSGTTGTPVAQVTTSKTVITLYMRKY